MLNHKQRYQKLYFRPHERTVEDLEIIYEELLHIKALSHLSTMVKRELASVLVFESHAKSGTVCKYKLIGRNKILIKVFVIALAHHLKQNLCNHG